MKKWLLLSVVGGLLSPSVVMAAQGAHDDKIPSISWDQLKQGEFLGSGGFGEVFQGVWHGQKVAIKKLHMKNLSKAVKKDFDREAELIWKCQFPCILKLYGTCTDPGQASMIFEYMPQGSLYEWLHDDDIIITDQQRWRIATDMAQGLDYLHKNNVIHRDLKSHNILLNNRHRAKISDFGLAKLRLHTNTTKTAGSMGTVRWCAPELFGDTPPSANRAMDIYSYGMILWELVTKQLPFAKFPNDIIVMGKVASGFRETIPEDCHPILKDIIQACWQTVPEQRPSAAEILQRLQESNPYPPPKPVWLPAEEPESHTIKAHGYAVYPGAFDDWQKVLRCYSHHPVPGYDVRKVEVIFNEDMNGTFKGRMGLLQQRHGNARYAPTWHQDSHADWRQKVHDYLEEMADPYTQDDYPDVKLIPLWHGTKKEHLNSLLSAGYTAFCTTDDGYFGKGLYGAHEAAYSHMYATDQGVLILNWAALYAAYFIIHADYDAGNNHLVHVPPEQYDAHFIPVVGQSPGSIVCGPPQPFQDHEYTEVMIKDSAQMIPRYLVTLQPSLPTSPPNTSQQQAMMEALQQKLCEFEEQERRKLKETLQEEYRQAMKKITAMEKAENVNEMRRLRAQAAEHKNEVAQLQAQITQLTAQKGNNTKQIMQLQEQVAQLQAAIKGNEEALLMKTQEAQGLQAVMEEQRIKLTTDKETAMQELHGRYQEQIKGLNRQHQSALQEQEGLLRQYQTTLEEKNDEIEQLRMRAERAELALVAAPSSPPHARPVQVNSPPSYPAPHQTAALPASPAPFVAVPQPVPGGGLVIPAIARGYEENYLRFMKGKLIYNQGQPDQVVLPFAQYVNPETLEGTFDLSRCGDSGRYIGIYSGYRQKKNPDNENRLEAWVMPRPLLEGYITTTAKHYQGMFSKWNKEIPVALAWTWGGWNDYEGACDYLITENMDQLSNGENLLKKYKKEAMRRSLRYVSIGLPVLHVTSAVIAYKISF